MTSIDLALSCRALSVPNRPFLGLGEGGGDRDVGLMSFRKIGLLRSLPVDVVAPHETEAVNVL